MGSIPNVTQRGYTSGALLPGYVCPKTTNTVAQSVERTTLNARSCSFFFCLPFVYPHILHAGKFWASLRKVVPSCVSERGCLVTTLFFCLECLNGESVVKTTVFVLLMDSKTQGA